MSTKQLIEKQAGIIELAEELKVSPNIVAHGLANILNSLSVLKQEIICMYFGIEWEEISLATGKKYTPEEIANLLNIGYDNVINMVQDVLTNKELAQPSVSYRPYYESGK
ncbi:MAG: hypothetical protein HYW78_03775 [Parcubacteria group bacterium]|nr:hypothetical protein [Parcubacteria group bacterium]